MVTLAMPAPPAWPTVVGHLYVFIPWILAHWEEYHTGMMVYGNGTWGVTEANYAVVLLHLTSGIFGPQMWNTSPMKSNVWAIRMVKEAGKLYPLLASIVQKIVALQMNHALLLLLGYMGLGLFASQVKRVFTVSNQPALLKDTMPKDERGCKQLGTSAAAFHLFQVILFHAVGAALLFQNQSGMYLPGMTRLSLATFGITYALQATRLIMAHMSKEPFTIALWPVVGQAVQAANLGVYRFADPVVVGWIVNIAVIVGYLHYVTNIISEVCDFLDINALTIKKKNGAVVVGGEKREKSNGSVRKKE
jgi:ethanolaminephosphotransferase